MSGALPVANNNNNKIFRNRGFRLLVLGFMSCGFHVAAYTTHVPAFCSDQGLESWVASTAITLTGVGNILGTYLSGRAGGTCHDDPVL